MAANDPLRSVGDIESFMTEYYAAWSGTDEDRIMSYYADNVTVQIPGVLMQGKSAVREQFVRPYITGFPGNRHVVKNMIFGQDVVVVEFSFNAEHKGSFAGREATDAHVEVAGSGVYEYDSTKGQITAARIYFDVRALLKQISDPNYPRVRTEEASSSASASLAPVEHLDLSTVIAVSQTVSGEMVLEKLLDTLMRTAVKHAGAERALLILSQEANQRIAAEAITNNDTVLVRLCDEPVNGSLLPEAVLRHVLHARESVILDDATTLNPFSMDPYIARRRPRSVFCLPLMHQAKYVGVLYLENTLAPGVFAPARTAVLKLLTSQAAISLENSRLYRDLANREARIKRLWDSNILGICTWDLNGAVVSTNEEFLRMLQYDRDDVASGRLRWTDLTPPEWREQNERAVAELRSTGTFRPVEKEYFRKDGGRVPVLIGGALLEGSRNEGVAFVLDLTERKRAEKASRESEVRFRDYAETASDWFWEIGPDYRFTLLTENAFGSDAARRIGTVCWDHALDLETEPDKWRLVRETLAARQPFRDFVYRGIGPNGPMYVKASGKPVFDSNGEFTGYRGTGSDVTAIIRAQEALRESERDFRSALDGIPGLVAILAPDGGVEAINQQIAEYCGRSLEELKNWGTNGTIYHEDLPHLADVFTRSIASGVPYEMEARLRRFDGEYRWFVIRGVPVRDASDRIARWYSLLTDIDGRKRAEEALHVARAELAHATRVMTLGALTASIAHEVNQPLSGIITNANTCLRMLGADPPNLDGARATAQRTLRDGNRASEIIQRLRALFAHRERTAERVDLNEAAREVLALSSSELQRSGVVLRTDFYEGLPTITGDRVQLQQVILNLILNAVEAMRTVDDRPRNLLVATTGEDGTGVRLSVRDSGGGVDVKNFDKLFDAFFTTKSSGMGVGLSISRSIIESHDGRIWVANNDGPGATFSFSIPRAPN